MFVRKVSHDHFAELRTMRDFAFCFVHSSIVKHSIRFIAIEKMEFDMLLIHRGIRGMSENKKFHDELHRFAFAVAEC